MNKENVGVQGRMVRYGSERDATMPLRYENVRARETPPRKDDTEDDTPGTVGGLGKGNFVDATFPAVSQAIEPRKRASVSAGQRNVLQS